MDGTPRPPQVLHRFLPLLVRWPRVANAWPPFRGAGIRVVSVSPDRRSVRVELRQRWWNTNTFGGHFGGSLYAMCDPFLVLLVMHHLGPRYRVWDKGADIRFRRPGRGLVSAVFTVTPEQLAQVLADAHRDGVAEVRLPAAVHDATGTLVAEVEKIVYVRPRVRS